MDPRTGQPAQHRRAAQAARVIRPGNRERLRRPLAALVSAAILLGLAASPAAAAVPLISTTLKVSPTAVVDGGTVVWTGTVKPASGTPTNVRLHLEATAAFEGGTCTPAAYCTVDRGPTWVLPTVTTTVTLTFTTTANTGVTGRLFLDSDGVGCSSGCPSTAYLPIPTVAGSAKVWTDTGDIPSGSTLHVEVNGWATAAPMDANLHVNLGPGLDPPTSIVPTTATYSPAPYHYIDDNVTLGAGPETLTFDTVVNAPNGSTVTIEVYVFAANSKYGYATGSISFKVGPDTVPPTATAPSRALVIGSGIAGSGLPVRIGWAATDALSGVARYELGQSTDGGSWATVSTTLTSPSLYRYASSGHTYRFRVRAVDRAGNVGAWAYGSTFRVTGVSQASSAVRYAGTWATSTSTTWWGGTARSSSRAGSTATYTFTGRSIAWVGLKGVGRGKANVYVNGVLKATVDLYSATTKKQLVVWSANYSTSATRTVTIKVLGTAGRPRVDVDGFIVGS